MSEQSEVQKNWNEFYHNNNNNNKKNGPGTIFLYFVLILAIATLVYKYIEYENEKSNKDTELTQSTSKFFSSEKNKDNSIDTDSIINKYDDEDIIISNKNGKIMAENVNRILDIVNGLSNISNNNYDSYINEINRLDLSQEYDKLKSAAIDKINYFSDYVTYDYNEKAFNKYNNIDIHQVLAECFDDAEVDYIIEDNGKIRFWYKRK